MRRQRLLDFLDTHGNGNRIYEGETNKRRKYHKVNLLRHILRLYKSRCDGFTFHHIQLSDDVITSTEPDDIPDVPDEPDKPDTPESPEYPDNVRNMLLFNEVMYDNAKDGAEYIEFYNPADQDITVKSLRLFKMRATGEIFSTTILKQEDENTNLVIPGKGYICFTHSATTLIRKHKVDGKSITEISKFPQLSNDGGYLALATDEEHPRTIDTCRFIDWMHDTSVTTGISLEKISPELPSLNKTGTHREMIQVAHPE